jgi:hypothetical protein
MIENEHDIPMPPTQPVYPFDQMTKGDSFSGNGGAKAALRVRSAAGQYGKPRGQKFAVRKEDNGRWRCWRIE